MNIFLTIVSVGVGAIIGTVLGRFIGWLIWTIYKRIKGE